jgi:type I restriction enzyme S subunit
MKLPRYPKYKDSGVEWLGEVPSTWSTQRIRFLFEIRKRIADTEGFDVLSITQQGIKIKDLESNDGQLSMDYSRYQFVEIGDFAMNHMDLLTGYVDISQFFGVTSPDYRVFSLRNPNACNDRYFLYIFQNAYKQKIFYAFGQGSSQLGRWRLPTEGFQDFVLPLPSLQEQSAIAAFIDRETDKIDALVEEQRRLIELLKEKRQAVISHAVTKGLNPDAPMKDSGIEWLGEVPKHWDIKSLKLLVSIRYGIGEPPSYQEDGTPLIRATNVSSGKISSKGLVFVDPQDIPEKRIVWLQPGDIIVVRSGAYTGDSAIILDEHVPSIAGFDMVVRPVRCDPRFLQYALLSCYMKESQIDLERTRAAQPHLNAEELGACFVLVPPPDEQLRIASHLDLETAKVDELMAAATRAIDLLQERRTALISAAVTGKIDVRGLSGTEAA